MITIKKIAILLITIGLVTLCYPQAQLFLVKKEQRKIIDVWEGNVSDVQQKEVPKQQSEELHHMLGVLQIEKINLEIPIFDKLSEENLKLGLTTIKEQEVVGEGNFSVAGHRSHTFGKMFNRLYEVEYGDFIHVKTNEATYIYKVVQKEIIPKEQVQVLSEVEGKKMITLITCHPLYQKDPPNRLMVQGELVKKI